MLRVVKRAHEEESFPIIVVVAGAGLEAGATVKEIASALDYSERHMYDLLDKYEVKITALRTLLRPVIKVNRREIKRVALEKAEEEFGERFGAALAAVDAALLDADAKTGLEAAKEIFNRNFGKSTATLNVNNRSVFVHAHVTSAEALTAFDDDLGRDAQLLRSARLLTVPETKGADADRAS